VRLSSFNNRFFMQNVDMVFLRKFLGVVLVTGLVFGSPIPLRDCPEPWCKTSLLTTAPTESTEGFSSSTGTTAGLTTKGTRTSRADRTSVVTTVISTITTVSTDSTTSVGPSRKDGHGLTWLVPLLLVMMLLLLALYFRFRRYVDGTIVLGCTGCCGRTLRLAFGRRPIQGRLNPYSLVDSDEEQEVRVHLQTYAKKKYDVDVTFGEGTSTL